MYTQFSVYTLKNWVCTPNFECTHLEDESVHPIISINTGIWVFTLEFWKFTLKDECLHSNMGVNAQIMGVLSVRGSTRAARLDFASIFKTSIYVPVFYSVLLCFK